MGKETKEANGESITLFIVHCLSLALGCNISVHDLTSILVYLYEVDITIVDFLLYVFEA